MKPRSIISLIIAAVLVLAGIITCAAASAKAKNDGVMLFPEADSEGNLVYRMELDSTTKITVDSADADITVIGGAEKSVIEVVNFNANYYKLTQSNGSLNFAQVDDFMSMFKFWDNGFSFKGMRYILRFGDDALGDKRIIIRLSEKDDISLINLQSETGDISLKDCGYKADYTLKCDDGTLTLENITGCSSLNIYGDKTGFDVKNSGTDKLSVSADEIDGILTKLSADEADISFTEGAITVSESTFGDLGITTENGKVTVSDYICTDGSITSNTGDVKLSFDDTASLAASVSTVNGKVSVNGEFVDQFSINTADPKHRITVSTASGDVYITYPKK